MAYRSFIILSSMRRTSAVVQRRTSSFFASKQPTRSFLWPRPGHSSNSSPRSPWWRWIINTQANQTSRRIGLATAAFALMFTIGCRQDMHDQPKFIPLRGTEFFADGRSARPQVQNTVARDQLHTDSYFETGLVDGKEGNAMPFPVTLQALEGGQAP